MKRATLYFTAPGRVEIRESPIPPPAAGEVLVRTLRSGISSGTELLVYRGLCPEEIPLDETIAAFAAPFRFPATYGYSTVGRVERLGPGVGSEWAERLVFVFHPHESHFLARPAELHPLPPGLSPEAALFAPTLETAVNLMLDGRPVIGEQVAVFGQGIVGLLTAAVLARHPLGGLITVEREALRRRCSLLAGANASLDADDPETAGQILARTRTEDGGEGADLVYELSGAPEALDQALAVTRWSGRVVVGSWYGKKPVRLHLGGRFHRSRIRLITSQVSTIDPALSGRWSRSRRMGVVWPLIAALDPGRFISHRFPLARAAEAYACLDRNPGACVQVVLTYE